MKRFLLHILLVISILVGSGAAYGAVQSVHDQRGKGTGKHEPGEQEPNLDGVVEVSFKIDPTGKVQILNINSTSPQLSEYVIKKLSKIQLESGNTQIGKVIKYRFVFKKQA